MHLEFKISSIYENAYGVYTPHSWKPLGQLRSEITHEVKYEQDNEHEAESASATSVSPVSITAAAEDKNENNNKEDEHHKDIG